MSVNAYVRARTIAETPRSTEYRLMTEITRELIAARDAGQTGVQLAPALHRNREVWGAFRTLCSDPANALPDELRAAIVSLSLWVDRHTSKVISGRESLEDLIEVNTTVMAGLANENGANGPAATARA